MVSRLAPEKGIDVAIDACRIAGVPLVVAGDGPEGNALRSRAGDGDVSFAGHVDDAELQSLRAGAALAIVPSRSAETFGMAAAEAIAPGAESTAEAPEPETEEPKPAKAEPAEPQADVPAAAEPEPDSAEEPQAARRPGAKKNAKARRSSVPSWDEIMLGSSRQRD